MRNPMNTLRPVIAYHYQKKTGFKIDTVHHRMERERVFDNATVLNQRHSIGITIQIRLGDINAPVQQPEVKKIASIGEIVRTKFAKMAEGKTDRGTV